MSYHCDQCNKIRYGAELKVPYKIREVVYEKYHLRHNRETKKSHQILKDSSQGTELVEEHRLCAECYETHQNSTPIVEKSKTVRFIEERPKRVFTKRRSNNDTEEKSGKFGSE